MQTRTEQVSVRCAIFTLGLGIGRNRTRAMSYFPKPQSIYMNSSTVIAVLGHEINKNCCIWTLLSCMKCIVISNLTVADDGSRTYIYNVEASGKSPILFISNRSFLQSVI